MNINHYIFLLNKEKEKQYENELTKEEQLIPGESNKETGLATIKTFETIKSVRITAAIIA